MKDSDGYLKSFFELKHFIKANAWERFLIISFTGDLYPFSKKALGVG
jgi:hypothetical protein